MGKPGVNLGSIGREKAVLGDRRQAARHERFGSTGLSAQERCAFGQLDGEPGQEIVADDAELSFSGLKQEVVAGKVEIRFFNARKRNRRPSHRSFRPPERPRRQRTPRRAIVQEERAGHPVSGEFNVRRRPLGTLILLYGRPPQRAPWSVSPMSMLKPNMGMAMA